MNSKANNITRYQMLCIGFVALLSPIIRLLPQQLVNSAGPHAWLTTLISLVPLLLVFMLVLRFFKYALPNEGYCELFLRSLGKTIGKVLIMLFTLWMLFYTAFALRSAADRYVSTAYFNTDPKIFCISMMILCIIPALGRFRVLGRTAECFFPLLVITLIFVFAFSFTDVDFKFIPPPTAAKPLTFIKGVPTVANVMSVAVYMGFLEGRIGEKASREKMAFIWLGLITLVIMLLCVVTVGTFGETMTSRLSYPFFIVIRNLSLFNFLERLEAIILALWVFTDYALISAMLFAIVNNLRVCFNYIPESAESEKALCLKNGRWLIWLSAALVLLGALFIAPDALILSKLSRELIPGINNVFTFGLLPLVIIVGLLRKKV